MYDYVQEGCLYLSVVDLNACHMRCSSKPQECETKHVTGFPKETRYVQKITIPTLEDNNSKNGHTHNSNTIPKQNHLLE